MWNRLIMMGLLLLAFAGCCKKEDLVGVNFDLSIKERVSDSGARVAASVPDFDQKFGEVFLLITNTVTSTQKSETATGDYVRYVAIPAGNYDFYMSGDGNQVWNDHLKFTSSVNGVDVVSGITITMPVITDQALILFVKAGLDAAPTIEVETDASHGIVTMYDDTNYYYIYVYGGWRYEINYVVSGNPGSMVRQFAAKKIYRYTIEGSTIGTTEPFDEVIENY